MNKRYVIVLILALSSAVSGQVNRDDLTPLEVAYTTAIGDDHKTLSIGIEVRNVCRPTTRIAMPNWSPGAYGLRRYGARVNDLKATGQNGKELEVTRLDHQTWSIATDGVESFKVSYSIKHRSRRFGRIGNEPATGMQFSGPSTYAYVVGAKNRPVTVRYALPDGWRVANGLLPTSDPSMRRARDYDTFIDAPTLVGTFKDFHFEVKGTPFSCVFFSNNQKYDFDMQAFVEICRKIVVCQGQLFGSFPFPNYIFLFTLPGGGGLEHLNSTSIGLNPVRMKRDVRAGASVTAHEFFHTWNVKRIRPKVLGPFAYEHENYTGNLWVSEGWTSYYGDLTMARTGIISREDFLGKLRSAIAWELNKESRKEHSVYWASRNTWNRRRGQGERVDYYAKGEILGAAIDLKIRHETDNKKSLDDVMRFFNRWFAERDVGFLENDVERACTAISNYDFNEFFARHVFGTLDPPLREYLAYAGIEYTEDLEVSTSFPFAFRSFGDTMRVGRRIPGAPTDAEIPERGDRIIAINGRKDLKPVAFLKQHKPGDEVSIAFMRGDKERELKVSLLENKRMTPTLRFSENATKKQHRIRESWLTGK